MRHAVLFVLCLTLLGAAEPSEPAGEGVALLVQALAENDDPQFHLDVLKGMNAAMEGRRRVAPPSAWPTVRDRLLNSRDRRVRAQAQSLAVVFGDAVAF